MASPIQSANSIIPKPRLENIELQQGVNRVVGNGVSDSGINRHCPLLVGSQPSFRGLASYARPVLCL